jgi:tRNA (guanine-N7-)-methyltransferase
VKPPSDSVRIWPADWLNPLPLDRHFAAAQPLEVDLGCGKGRFLLERAGAHPELNYLGIDRMLRRIRKIDHKAQRRGLRNLRLLRVEGYYAVAHLMPAEAVQTYYIFFPDPWPKKRHHENRLFNPRFLDALYRTLRPGGAVHVATDHQPYFEIIRDILRGDPRFEEIETFQPAPQERTEFELWYLDKSPIGRLSVRRRASPDAPA